MAIFCLMGKSSSGKDTIYKKLLSDEGLKLTPIVPGTTRPRRDGEVDGREYVFYTEDQLEKLKSSGRIAELRSYDTVYGIWYYFTVADDHIKPDSEDYILIGTLEAYNGLVSYYGEGAVVPVYIFVDDGERLMRALNRERSQKNPKYAEMCRRFLGDEEDFSEEKLEASHITKRFENLDLDETVKNIKDWIADRKNM
ncbi:MAG: guanylate kinase [Lachnospiraceae bacterium]|nr:guanylate kinase [Lachnospiraceae bacterium]